MAAAGCAASSIGSDRAEEPWVRPDKPRRPTVADVAQRAGTSTAVVSYVLNDGPRPVSESTRSRVLAAIDELAYRPSRSARTLRSRHSQFIGLVMPGTIDPYYVELSLPIEQAAARRGHLVMIANSDFDPAQEVAITSALIDEGVPGIAIAGLGASPSLARLIEASDVRVVFVHHRPEGYTGPLVAVDDRRWARHAVEHLIGHGHTRIACLGHHDDDGPVGARVSGWRDALSAAGLAHGDELIIRSGVDRLSASAAAEHWLKERADVTAVFAATDELAFGLMHRAGVLGIAIPSELAVFGFDGVSAAATSVPELSTIVEPFADIGERVAALLFEERDDPKDHQLECRPVYRASCGCR
ncbi:LacI family DNA-binding transcriptional regulator [Microbacterium lushaniae]|uniref:LacI family transcriptional regulator n=1 Tax=Microbacterium lushaniae TaxID=2614639 RepID=A0A5J6L1A8_9MICO|nr:LacI family DNA-binding transcriptional regulator [Microbacterium lushaniae]QEW02269.1 LacI family transcriptional regulator [Microbacterium lushaniae]